MRLRHRIRMCRHTLPLLLLVLAVPAAADEPSVLLPAGRYRLASQMQMPHLEEMRRQVAHLTRCIADDDLRALFPVLDQPALRGCALGFPRALAKGMHYSLVCQSARVASGTADVERTRRGVIGMLRIKMGGKNMTFTQRVEAERLAPVCDEDPPG